MFVEKIAGQECETAARFYRPMMLNLNIFSGAKKKNEEWRAHLGLDVFCAWRVVNLSVRKPLT